MRGELREPAASADVSITVEILPEAQRLIDEADERWSTEHGFDAVNPLLDGILHAAELLRENPELGVVPTSPAKDPRGSRSRARGSLEPPSPTNRRPCPDAS